MPVDTVTVRLVLRRVEVLVRIAVVVVAGGATGGYGALPDVGAALGRHL